MKMKRWMLFLIVAIVVGGAVTAGVRSGKIGGGTKLEVVNPRRGKIRESFREPARTRLENTWRIALQVSGRIGRIELEPGDRVKKGQSLVEFDREPLQNAAREVESQIKQLDSNLAVLDDDSLELTELAAAEELVLSAESSVKALESQVESARRRVEYTQKELDRIGPLAEAGSVSDSQLDDARYAADTARLDLNRAQSDFDSRKGQLAANRLDIRRVRETIARKRLQREAIVAELDWAKIRLDQAEHDLELARVVSPIDGVVLERFERGEKPLLEGSELMMLGNPADIEVLADVLTEDALKLAPGDEVLLESLAGGLRIKGTVKHVEPQGFTKLSSLGVEQQRVYVIVSIENPPPKLGVGYRLHARFYTGDKEDALIVPRFTVMQSPDQSYYVLVAEGGRLARRPVKLGLRSDLNIEILEGLDETSAVVASPDSTMDEGMAVRPTRVP